MYVFTARLEIIVGNPYVLLPQEILYHILEDAGKSKGPIPVKGTINGNDYQQTLLKYSGKWRLYINLKMLKNSPRRIGETLSIEIAIDPSDRTIKPHPLLIQALKENPQADEVFNRLSASK